MVQVHQGRAAKTAAPCQERFPQCECLCLNDLDGLYSGIIVLTPEGIALEINEVPLAEAQIRREEVIGQTGAYRWFLTRAMPVRDDAGQIVKWFGTSTDIEDQKRTEQRLKESRENLRVLAETVPQLVWTTSPDGWVEYWNQRWYIYTGSSPEHTLGHEWSQFLHPDDYQHTLTIWHHALETGEPYEIEYRLKEGQTGAYRWFLTRGAPVRDETGQIVKWFGTCTDIEDQKRIEEALRESQERIRALIDSNIIGIVSNEGEEDVLVEANEAFLHMTGYTQEDVRSRTLTRGKIIAPEQAPLFQRPLQELAERGQHHSFETELVCKDGSRLPIIGGAVLLQDRPRQIISFVLDNSARKELDQRKDDFISMASHELKTPLTAVKIQTQLVRRHLAKHSQHEAATELSRVESPIKQLERLIAELLDVSKIQAGRLEYVRELVDLDELVREVTDTMQLTSPSHAILVRGRVQTSLIGDRDRLKQVFTNLLSNAIKYSPDATTAEVELSASAEAVTVRVTDHGLGIPREQRDKIFERFYRVTGSRMRAISGLGMGLYIVAEIVKHHGGSITVDSDVGKGSTFTVTLSKRRREV
jgi:PAS domain S-box-containing protein